MSSSKILNNTVEVWVKFDLESVKKELDERVIEIAQLLDEGDQSRKQLIEQTKDFRKKITEDQRKLVGPVLKSFQVEVDASLKRSKLMEQVLLKLYKQLIDLPDPCLALENAQKMQKKAERVQDLEIENKQLRDTLDEYNVEFAQVKNQEVTIKMLKDKIKELEEKLEANVQQRVKEKEKELQRIYAEKEEAFNQIQFDLSKKLSDQEARSASLNTQLVKMQADLYEFKSKQDEQLNAKSCEIDLLLSDLDKMTERAVNAERLNEQYMEKVSINKELNSAKNSLDMSDDLNSQLTAKKTEMDLLQKEKEISQLVKDLKKIEIKSNKAKEFYESQRVNLEEKLASRERTLEQLEYELIKKNDYDEIKKELNILKTIEFNVLSPSDNESSTSNSNIMVTNEVGAPASAVQQQMQQKPLEVLFLEKNRFLQNENTQIKTKLSDLQIKYDDMSKEKEKILAANVEQKKLIETLEKDLLKLAKNENQMNAFSSDQTVVELNEFINNNNNSNSNESSMARDRADQASLFNIVSNQRERFRLRIQELENENITNKQQVAFITNEIDRLRSDNVKLYEKIKFLQSASKHSIRKASSRNDDSYDFLNNDDSNIILNKYTNEYEKKLDPFSKFNYREKQKRYANLKLHDKFTLSFGKFVLSNKIARLIFCGYFFVIHLLIFLSLYHMAHDDARHRDYSAACASSYKDHMDKMHGMHDFQPPN